MRRAIAKCSSYIGLINRCQQRTFSASLNTLQIKRGSLQNNHESNITNKKSLDPLQEESTLMDLFMLYQQVMVLGCDQNPEKTPLNELVKVLIEQNIKQKREKLGLLIVTSSRDQSADVYAKLKYADKDKKLSISRFGSASYIAPHISTEDNKRKGEHHKLNQTSVENLAKIAETEGLDILVTTLWEASILSPLSQAFKPEYILLQDFELLFDENHRLVERLLHCLDPDSKTIWTSRNPNPEMPQRLYRWLPESHGSILSEKKELSPLRLEQNHTVGRKTKINKVIDIIRKNSNKRGVIFCRDPEEAKLITRSLTKSQLRAYPYTSVSQTPQTSWSLLSFKFGVPSTLVAEEHALRSVDVLEADYAIWLDNPAGPEEEYYRRRALRSCAPVLKFTEL